MKKWTGIGDTPISAMQSLSMILLDQRISRAKSHRFAIRKIFSHEDLDV